MRACVFFARHPKIRGSLLPHAYRIYTHCSSGHSTVQHFLECHTDFDPNVTPEYITDCLLASTSNSEHIMSNIALGVLLVKVL